MGGLAQGVQADRKEYAFVYGLYQDGMYEEAVRAAEQFVQKYPQSRYVPDAFYLMGDATFLMKDYRRSIDLFKQLIDRYGHHPLADDAMLRSGQAWFNLKDYTRASQQFLGAMQRFPSSNVIPELLYWYAESEFQLGHNDIAIEHYQKLIGRYPDHELAPHGYYSLGWLYDRRGKKEQALAMLEELRKKYPNHPLALESYFMAGDILLRSGKYDEAIQICMEGLRKDTGKQYYDRGLFLLGEAQYGKKNYAEALEFYSRLTREVPKSEYAVKAQYAAGWTYYQQKNYVRAAEIFEQLWKSSPDPVMQGQALYFYASALRESGKKDEAARLLETLISRYPKNDYVDDAHYDLALLYFEKNDFPTALEHFQAVQQTGGSVELKEIAVKGMADCYFRLGKEAEAADILARTRWTNPELKDRAYFEAGYVFYTGKNFQKALNLFSMLIRDAVSDSIRNLAYYWRGEIRYQLNQFDDAIQDLETFYQSPYGKEYKEMALYSLAWSYFNRGNYRKALTLFGNHRKLYPRSSYWSDIQVRMADCHFYLRNYDEAGREYESFLKNFPNHPDRDWAIYQLGNTYLKRKQFGKAREYFQRVAQNAKDPKLRERGSYMIGRSYFVENRFEEALRGFEQTLAAHPNGELIPRIHYEMGDCYYNLKQFDKALEWYRKVLDRFPSSEVVVDALSGYQWASLQLGREKEAFRLIRDFLQKNSGKKELWALAFREGDYFYANKEYEKARDSYLRLAEDLKGIPDLSARAYYWAGMASFKLADYETALEYFRRVAQGGRGNPNYFDALYQAVLCYIQLGNFERARMNLDILLQSRNELTANKDFLAEIYALKGDIERLTGKTADAILSYRQAIETAPGSYGAGMARNRLAEVYIGSGNPDAAEPLIQENLKLREDELAAQAQKLYGDLYRVKGDETQAISEYLKVKYLYRAFAAQVVEALQEAAKLYENQGNTEKAEQLRKELKENYPTFIKRDAE